MTAPRLAWPGQPHPSPCGDAALGMHAWLFTIQMASLELAVHTYLLEHCPLRTSDAGVPPLPLALWRWYIARCGDDSLLAAAVSCAGCTRPHRADCTSALARRTLCGRVLRAAAAATLFFVPVYPVAFCLAHIVRAGAPVPCGAFWRCWYCNSTSTLGTVQYLDTGYRTVPRHWVPYCSTSTLGTVQYLDTGYRTTVVPRH